MKSGLPAIIFACVLTLTAHAQTFSSGSTGADGALDLATMDCPNSVCKVQLPESGVLNYTTLNVPAGKSLGFKSNSKNTPVTILVQGAVTIDGSVGVSAGGLYCSSTPGFGTDRTPGPGGFYGGQPQSPGFGPGGGQISGANARWVGALSLFPITGGSGGAGQGETEQAAVIGGSGGGAIIIASSTSITISRNAAVQADGAYNQYGSCFYPGNSKSGSGGAIRLISNLINVLERITATGSGDGVIRIEAPSGAINFVGSSQPAAVLSTINPNITPVSSPSLTIASVGGYAVPSYSGARFDTVDLLLPNQLQDPVNVVVRANNIPVGTQIQVGFVSGSGQATSAPGTLSGSFASSTATATISGLARTGVTYLLATAVFDVPQSARTANPPGKNQVERVRVEATPGKEPEFVFLRKDGSAVEAARLAPAFLRQFGR